MASGLCGYLAGSVAVQLNVFVTNLRDDFVTAQMAICLAGYVATGCICTGLGCVSKHAEKHTV